LKSIFYDKTVFTTCASNYELNSIFKVFELLILGLIHILWLDLEVISLFMLFLMHMYMLF